MTWYTCGRHYEAPIDPLEVLNIDPSSVNKVSLPSSKDCFNHPNSVCEVIGGEWDVESTPIEEYVFYSSFQDHFKHNIPWEETRFYNKWGERFNAGESAWGCETLTDFNKRLKHIDDLYQTIDHGGYQSQKRLQTQSNITAHRKIHQYCPPEFNEVVVNVGRDGDFILNDGRHRLTIARILNLDKIPVRIKVRHKKWQRKRDKMVSNYVDSSNTQMNHPDMTQTISGQDRHFC
ncbi:hypothetical protein [Salinadaptatus halalkaliphilus]|uniref:hypothetical protein n=1 Tax=Salinadaptatus halalkaliphilus TaxID=2419781 RepID=UPI00114431DD|nr:hypothetical protein [Salinadaptatus halalkaliphilus]